MNPFGSMVDTLSSGNYRAANAVPPRERRSASHRTYTAQDLVRALDPLLEAVCLTAGQRLDRQALLDNLAACLKTSGKASTLSTDNVGPDDWYRLECARRADLIGESILTWATQASTSRLSLDIFGAERLKKLTLTSICDWHVWTSPVCEVLLGQAGCGHEAQLFNEWLHQLIVLRDALIAFDDWDTLLIPQADDEFSPDLRMLDSQRKTFVADFSSRDPADRHLAPFAVGLFLSQRGSSFFAFSPTASHFADASGNCKDRHLLEHPLDMELLRTFCSVVRYGGFTAAANRLHRTQAAVSLQIKRLEETVGVCLIRRSSRSFTLTAEGHCLLDYAGKILSLNHEALDRVRRPVSHGTPAGEIAQPVSA